MDLPTVPLQEAHARIGTALGHVGMTDTVAQGAAWTGRHAGRAWMLRLDLQTRTRHGGGVRTREFQGCRLRIEASTKAPVRAYVVPRGFAANALVRLVYRLRRFEVVPMGLHGLSRFSAVTRDADWWRALLSRPRSSSALAALADHREQPGASASVYFEPEALHFTSPLWQADEVQPERVAAILEALATLAHEAEQAPAPAKPARRTRWEAYARSNPTVVVLLLLAALVLGSMLVVTLPVWVAVLVA